MSVTDADFALWIEKDHANTVLLFELDYMYEVPAGGGTHTPTTGTAYFSDRNYVTGPSDTPANTPYLDVATGLPTYERAIDHQALGGHGSISLGTVEMANPDGALDYLLDLACDGSELRVYIGDRTWARADFRHVFTSSIERIDAPDTNSIRVQIKDALAILNGRIASTFIGGTGPNAERAKQLNLGYVHQVECLLEDFATLTYRYGTVSGLQAASVRDRGLAVAYTDNSDGTFSLSASPAGIITCDVLVNGPGSTYVASDLIEALITQYTALDPADYLGNCTPDTYPGPPTTAYGDGDLQLGIHVATETNVLDILDQLCFSAIAFYTFTREAKFVFGRIWPRMADYGTSVMDFTADDIRGNREVEIVHGDPTYYSWNFYFNKNWHVMDQGDFAGAVSDSDKAQFSAKGVYASNRTVRPGGGDDSYFDQPSPYHKTMTVSPETDTLLSILTADEIVDYPLATRWFRRERDIHFPWWEFVTFTVGLRAYVLELGNIVTLALDRYGWDDGVKFQVVGINLRLMDKEIVLTLFRQRGADVLPPNVHSGVGAADGTSTAAAVSAPHGFFSAVGSAAGTSTASAVGADAGGGGGTDTYTFDEGGIFIAGYAANVTIEDPDPVNTPAWYEDSAGQLQLNTGLAAGTDIDVYAGADALELKYPGYFESQAGGTALYVFNDTTTQVPLGGSGFIDYVSNASPFKLLRVSNTDPGDPFATLTGQFVAPYFQLFDASDGKVSVDLAIQFNQVIVGGGQAFGYLTIIVQNDSASTLTGVANTGADIHILLPSNASNPDVPGTGEWDISFNSDSPPTTFTAGTPYCAINDAGGATLSVSGTRHELQFSITTASITAGSRARFMFPLVVTTGADVPSVSGVGYFIPAVLSTITTTPSESVRVFTDDGSGLIQT